MRKQVGKSSKTDHICYDTRHAHRTIIDSGPTPQRLFPRRSRGPQISFDGRHAPNKPAAYLAAAEGKNCYAFPRALAVGPQVQAGAHRPKRSKFGLQIG